jgi:16S rRNA (cytosine967-C5)-methyltransferase
MIGLLRGQGMDPAGLFTGEGYAPPPLSDTELSHVPPSLSRGEALDVPDWLLDEFDRSLGEECAAALAALRDRAMVFLRVNRRAGSVEEAVAALLSEGIAAAPHPLATGALVVNEGARKVQHSAAYRNGLVEVQDAASQAVVAALLPVDPGQRVLDFCAGGGGKALALADLCEAEIHVHDIDAARMNDIPARAERAGVRLTRHAPGQAGEAAPFDLVLVDAPCSGSGAWRRQPDAKWRLTPKRLADLTGMQDDVLDAASPLVGPGGRLAYATCSLLAVENADRVDAFLARDPGWTQECRRHFTPLDGGDGFFVAILRRSSHSE